jgi:hypothetical protein
VHTGAFEIIETWRTRLQDQQVLSASEVQDRLFDLYGELEDYPSVELVKPWLTLTVHRELFGSDELTTMLDELSLVLNDEVDSELSGLVEEISEPIA